MGYILKQFDTPLLRFSVIENTAAPELRIEWVNEEKKALLPLDLILSPEGVSRWIQKRTIPKNRAYVNALLARCGLSINRPMSIIAVCKGLSLNDSYWVVEDGFTGTFDQYNLYDNRFSRILGLIAFTGYGSSIRSSLVSTPELTTNGMLPKCWRRIDGKVKLYKGGTSGASNAGKVALPNLQFGKASLTPQGQTADFQIGNLKTAPFEPYSEYYAAQVAEAMGINAIHYGLSKWKGQLCSTCELFTSRDVSFMPVGRLVTHGGFGAVKAFYEELGPEYLQALRDMVVFDAVIYNTDRHFGNFGFLIDNATNKIVAPAPLFDHGNSLFNFAGAEFMSSPEKLQEYADTLLPRAYEDYVETARSMMNDQNREQLRHLLGFRFKRHSHYNLPGEWLELIEGQLQKRAGTILH